MEAEEPGARSTRVGVVVGASLIATLGALPVFLLGAVAVLVRADLGFGEAQLGVAVSVYFASAALGSVPSGYVVEHLGGARALMLGAAASAVGLLGMAFASSWTVLLLWLVLCGLANAVSQLAANLRLADSVPVRRQGLAFGIKQSSIPAASLAGGVAVPALALTLGWRWAFGAAALVAIIAAGVQATRSRGEGRGVRRDGPRVRLERRPLLLLAAAAGFGAGAATAMAAFVVEYAVAVGIRPGPAGVVLAIGGVAAVLARVAVGWLADRRGGNLLVVVGMLFAGATAILLYPVVSTWWPLAAVTVVAYAVGWGWPGLFNLIVIQGNARAPAAATGITQVGVYVGGVTGPLAFGLMVGAFGYASAWWAAAGCLYLAAGLAAAGRAAARTRWAGPARSPGTSPAGP